ncbi:MAG: hypothetical protein J7497_02420, partial [Chitinophagaceae bacterium]|nr:hypothetical protein [Chitinophagaceae bacterium]
MKKNVLTFLLFGIFISSVEAQVSQSPECIDYDPTRYPLKISGIYQNGVGPQDVWFNWNTLWNFSNPLKQTRVTSINIGNTGLFRGLMQYLPASYNLPANATKKYPVIIYFHGGASIGDGSFAQLCRLFKDRGTDLQTHVSIPGRVERNTELFTQTYLGETHEYIVISPQFSAYTRLHPTLPDNFPTADHIEDVIDYVEQNYRIDPRRIYLTGFSNGANMISEYAASSVARAKRIAALMPVALCSRIDHPDNTSRGYNATYIGQAKLKTWFVYCEVDNCGESGSDYDAPVNWVNTIKSVSGNEPPRFTVLKNLNPPTLYNCSDTLTHDAWSRAYNPEFKASFVNGTGANDGINLNAYEWFARAQSAVLPVILQSYSARLIDDRVEINWTTSDEKDNKSFTIERAGKDQKFKPIGTVPGAINNTGNKDYLFIDNEPLGDLSYYRLVQN